MTLRTADLLVSVADFFNTRYNVLILSFNKKRWPALIEDPDQGLYPNHHAGIIMQLLYR
jgi:hypothetical protein